MSSNRRGGAPDTRTHDLGASIETYSQQPMNRRNFLKAGLSGLGLVAMSPTLGWAGGTEFNRKSEISLDDYLTLLDKVDGFYISNEENGFFITNPFFIPKYRIEQLRKREFKGLIRGGTSWYKTNVPEGVVNIVPTFFEFENVIFQSNFLQNFEKNPRNLKQIYKGVENVLFAIGVEGNVPDERLREVKKKVRDIYSEII